MPRTPQPRVETVSANLARPQSRGFRLTGLRPRQDPPHASSWAVENLYHAVCEWPADALVALYVARRGRAIWIGGEVNAAAPADWLDDLAYAFAPIGVVKAATTTPKLAQPLLEVVPWRAGQESVDDFLDPRDPDSKPGRDAVPIHKSDPMWDFLRVLVTVPDAAFVVLASPASDLEQQMCDAAWRGAFQGSSKVEWQIYRGTPVRARALLYSSAPAIPARLRAEVKMMSQRVAFQPVPAQDRAELRRPGVDAVKGFAVPKQVFRALVHLPAAGEHRPAPGLKLLAPAPFVRPYDPGKKPADGLRIGRCRDSHGRRRPVCLTPADLCRHLRLVGATGSGKSTALRALVGAATEAGHGVMVLDPHGTLCRDLMGDLRNPGKVLHVDFSDPENIVPFNPLAAWTEAEFEARLQAFMNIIISRDSEEFTGPRWRRAFGLVARGCRQLWGQSCSLVQVFAVLGSRDLAGELAAALRHSDRALAAQISQELALVGGEAASELWAWLVCKGEEILGSHALMRILGTGEHAFNLTWAINGGDTVLVNLGLAELGERSAQLVGCALVAEFRQAMLARRDRTKPYFLVVDEAHLFQYGALPSLLDEARKFGVGVIVSHQRPDQLTFQVKDALTANAGSYIQLRTGNPADAATAAALLDGWPPADLVRLKDLTGAATLSRGGVITEPFSLEIDFFARHADALADTELRAWREAEVRRLSFEQLVRPYGAYPVITRDNVAAAMRAARRRRDEAENRDPDSPFAFDFDDDSDEV